MIHPKRSLSSEQRHPPRERYFLPKNIRLFVDGKKQPLTTRLQADTIAHGPSGWRLQSWNGAKPLVSLAKHAPACKFPHYSRDYTCKQACSIFSFFIIPCDVPERERRFRQFSSLEVASRKLRGDKTLAISPRVCRR